MHRTDANAGAGARAPGGSHQGEVKAALTGFLGDFSSFQSAIKSKLKEQETRLAMLDRKSIAMSRPPLARGADTETPHKKAFAAYLRSGDDDGLRNLSVEEKALSTAVAAEGGYLVDPQVASEIVGALRSAASIRSVATVVSGRGLRLRRADRPQRRRSRLGDRDRGADRDRDPAGRSDLDPAA